MSHSRVDTTRAVVDGLAAGSVYLGAMWVDNRLASQSYNDIKLVGQVFTTKSPYWIMQGVAGHYGFSVLMALLYANWAYYLLPGPGWLKGVIYLQVENATLYPVAVLLDNMHAGVKQGQLPRLLTWKSFLGQVTRHLAFGLTLGLLYRDKEG